MQFDPQAAIAALTDLVPEMGTRRALLAAVYRIATVSGPLDGERRERFREVQRALGIEPGSEHAGEEVGGHAGVAPGAHARAAAPRRTAAAVANAPAAAPKRSIATTPKTPAPAHKRTAAAVPNAPAAAPKLTAVTPPKTPAAARTTRRANRKPKKADAESV